MTAPSLTLQTLKIGEAMELITFAKSSGVLHLKFNGLEFNLHPSAVVNHEPVALESQTLAKNQYNTDDPDLDDSMDYPVSL